MEENMREEPMECEEVSVCRSPGGTQSDAMQVKSTTSEQELTEDTSDAMCPPLVQEEKVLIPQSNDCSEPVIIERVFLEEVSPQAKKMGRRHSQTFFYGSQIVNENPNLENIELVREKNMCRVNVVNSEHRRYIGRFHPDDLIVHENGFHVTLEPEVVTLEPEVVTLEPEVVTLEPEVVTLEPEVVTLEPEVVTLEPEVVTLEPEVVTLEPEVLTLNEHDGGKQAKVNIPKNLRRKKEPQTFKFTVPEDQQRECQIVFGKMRKSLGSIVLG